MENQFARSREASKDQLNAACEVSQGADRAGLNQRSARMRGPWGQAEPGFLDLEAGEHMGLCLLDLD